MIDIRLPQCITWPTILTLILVVADVLPCLYPFIMVCSTVSFRTFWPNIFHCRLFCYVFQIVQYGKKKKKNLQKYGLFFYHHKLLQFFHGNKHFLQPMSIHTVSPRSILCKQCNVLPLLPLQVSEMCQIQFVHVLCKWPIFWAVLVRFVMFNISLFYLHGFLC